ncbi:uncharacterized protein BT62DRAFT_937397 [Guyanagaster necrorhizus]|uniref:GST N-terminal domain-containing protein n=1 Tax=Guyanagaster necrorhizus TaxID=856835 RepID=A0A9P8AMD7_9AGAR|nr:uncharacterized protein BT62DRAFT_937397 [Guyanagaster necrorhizus MCA 3950]KAG7441153.1 hypothetical protein BT62DRAFT_937397 [Guyanagaster necrorhizus MCA 3950]
MSSKLITLYDIPTKLPDSPGSPTTWRARYSLNMKNLPYQTVYVELPDIEALAKRIGAAPTSTKQDGVTPLYTVPIIQDHATGAVVSESAAIAAYLDKTYPSGLTLVPAGTMPLQLAFRDAVSDVLFGPFRGFVIEGIMPKLTDRTAEYWKGKFVKQGGNLEDLFDGDKVKAWEKAMASLRTLDKWFEGNEGPFIMGNEPCFADAVLAGFLRHSQMALGKDSKEWKDVGSWNGGKWVKYLDSFSPYEAIL